VHCRINEPRKTPSAGWYSKKYNKAGVSYELGIAIHHNKLVWINGPFPAGTNDITIYRKPNGLMSKIPAGKHVIGDQGYRGEPGTISTRNRFDTPAVKKLKCRTKARHESFNSRIKDFKVLDERFRHGLQKHKACFEACCVIVQYDLDNGRAMFTV
jgi:SRSO17 transposase